METELVPDRIVNDFDPPPAAPMDEDILFPNKKEGGAKAKKAYLPDWKALRDHLSKEGKISKES